MKDRLVIQKLTQSFRHNTTTAEGFFFFFAFKALQLYSVFPFQHFHSAEHRQKTTYETKYNYSFTKVQLGKLGCFRHGGRLQNTTIPMNKDIILRLTSFPNPNPKALWNISILVFYRMTMPPYISHCMTWWVSIWCKYALAFTDSRSQPSWKPVEDFGLTCCTSLSTNMIKTPNKGTSFGRMMFHLPDVLQRLMSARRGPKPYGDTLCCVLCPLLPACMFVSNKLES